MGSLKLHFSLEFAEKYAMKWMFFLIIMLSAFSGVAQDNKVEYRNLKNSSFDWGKINIEKFLSFKDWKDSTDDKEQVKNWEAQLKERSHKEIAGHFFQCVGFCRIDRGESFFNPSFRTPIYEGDEIKTNGESFAWLFLLDGTMIRLAPESSITINEFNTGINENFIFARINTGNVIWLSRKNDKYELNNVRETDVLFFPLSLYEAQPNPDRKDYKEDKLFEMLEEKKTVENQIKNLNEIIEKNNKWIGEKNTFSFVTAPNVTFFGYNPNVEIVSLIAGKSYLKKRSSKFLGLIDSAKDDEIMLQLRGFDNKEFQTLPDDKWLAVEEKGKSVVEEESILNWLTMGEFVTKRIPSLLVARELLLEKYSTTFFIKDKKEFYKKANLKGYRVWGSLKSEDDKKSDLELRLDFLKEYTRRSETNNLVVAQHFTDRLKERGEKLKTMEYSNFYFIKALNTYYSYDEFPNGHKDGEELNSTTKTLWKRIHGFK